MLVPNKVFPLKNSTLAIEPSASAALAVRVILAGAVNVAPFTGEVTDTVGATNTTGAFTVRFMVAKAEVAPVLSVALAVKV